MLSNYFTLFRVAEALHRRLAGTVIAGSYSQEKNTLSLLFYTPEPLTLTIDCTPRENSVLLRTGDHRQRSNSVSLFPALIDRHIRDVFISPSDRVLYLRLTEGGILCAEMFGSKANVVLCSDTGEVRDAFFQLSDVNAARSIPADAVRATIVDVLPSPLLLRESLRTHDDPVRALRTAVPKLGAIFAQEVLHRAGSTDPEMIERALHGLVTELLTDPAPSPCIYFDDREPVCVSPLPLRQFEELRKEEQADIFQALLRYVSTDRSSHRTAETKKGMITWVKKELEKVERTIRSVEEDLASASRAEQYERYGMLLMTHLPSLTKGMEKTAVDDVAGNGETVVIPMDASLSPQKNAERYFEKAKRSRAGREESRKRLETLAVRKRDLQDLLEKINHIADGFSLKKSLHSLESALKELGHRTAEEEEALPPFKIFTVDGGFTVYAGKSSENNDLLTFRYAKPNDLWFHARGSSGSHVVLKLASASGDPSKKAVEQAAGIAAYYSKMKNAKHVPVAMTERKYIRKPKGAPSGTVALEKEKVIFVQPLLPE